MDARAAAQESEYEFPYHHIAHFDGAGSASRARILQWAVEYLVYTKRVADVVAEHAPASLLDVGCGDGRFLGLVPASIPRRVGMDASERAISFARAFHPEIEFHARDADDTDETFEVVTAMEVLEHVPDDVVPHFLNTLADRTEPGGTLLLVVPITNAPVPPKHYRHDDEALLRSQLQESGAPLKSSGSSGSCVRRTAFGSTTRSHSIASGSPRSGRCGAGSGAMPGRSRATPTRRTESTFSQ